VAFALLDAGASSLAVANRDPARGGRLVAQLAAAGGAATALPLDDPDPAAVAAVDLVVNATPMGAAPGEDSPLPTALFRAGQRAVDLLYAPEETPFVAAARAAGAWAVNGLAMLLFQGAEAQPLWTGREAPLAVMAEALCRAAGVPAERLAGADRVPPVTS
jgi:shikimate dehydrogenase